MITSNSILFTIICVFAIQAIILSILILKKQPRILANKFLAILTFFYAIMALNIVLVNVLKDYNMLNVFRYIQMEMLYGIGPALYFYTKSITNPKFKFEKAHYYHFLPVVLEFIFYRTTIYRIGSNGLYLEEMPTYSYVYLTQQWIGVISILVYSFISLGILIKYQNQLKNYYSKIDSLSLKWLQTPIIIYVSYHVFWRILTEVDRFFFDKSLREYYFLPNFVVLSIITCWIGFKGYVNKNISSSSDIKDLNNPSPKIEKEKDNIFLEKLENVMVEKKPYLNPDLNLSKLAEILEMKPKQVSSKINQNCSKNFYDLINSYRVKEFQQRVKTSNLQKFSLLGLAHDCGFNSKSTFNNVFKKHTQLTPSQYLKNIKNKS